MAIDLKIFDQFLNPKVTELKAQLQDLEQQRRETNTTLQNLEEAIYSVEVAIDKSEEQFANGMAQKVKLLVKELFLGKWLYSFTNQYKIITEVFIASNVNGRDGCAVKFNRIKFDQHTVQFSSSVAKLNSLEDIDTFFNHFSVVENDEDLPSFLGSLYVLCSGIVKDEDNKIPF